MTHWQDTMVDRPETDGAVYVTGWTISGCPQLEARLQTNPARSESGRKSGVRRTRTTALRVTRSGAFDWAHRGAVLAVFLRIRI